MNRRAVLGAALSAGLLAFADLAFAGVTPEVRRQLLSEQWRRAVTFGRPLLVIVLPADEGAWYDRGRSLGIWLNHASDADLALLGSADPVCCTLEELARLVPGVDAADSAWFVLVRVDQPTPTWRSVVVPTPAAVERPGYEDWSALPEQRLSGRDGLALRADWEALPQPSDEDVVRAVVLAYRGSVLRVLAAEGLRAGDPDAGRDRWVRSAPPGAHWGISGGCATRYEGVASTVAIGCGMGFVPAHARRFLAFWAVDGSSW